VSMKDKLTISLGVTAGSSIVSSGLIPSHSGADTLTMSYQ
jgi:hypothetical protein